MKEKKQFFIPKNYDKQFSWIPGISGWQQFIFVPVVALDWAVFKYTGFAIDNKIIFAAITLGVPWVLLGNHPVRPNVNLFKHLVYRIKFLSRQRKFSYKKEGYHAEIISKKATERADQSERVEKAAASKKISTRLNTSEINRRGILDHTRKQNDHVHESIGN